MPLIGSKAIKEDIPLGDFLKMINSTKDDIKLVDEPFNPFVNQYTGRKKGREYVASDETQTLENKELIPLHIHFNESFSSKVVTTE
jgi:hypothetical protein